MPGIMLSRGVPGPGSPSLRGLQRYQALQPPRPSPRPPHRTGEDHAPVAARQSPCGSQRLRTRIRIRIRLQRSPAPRAPPRAAAGTARLNVAGPTPPPCPALTHRCARGGTATHTTPGLRGRGGAGLWEVKADLRGGAPGTSSGAF